MWDTTAVADGRYVLRVGASDSPTNAADRALSARRDSDPIDVDNTPPAITTEIARQGGASRARRARARRVRARFRSSSTRSAAAPWQLVYPADGLADSPEERYEIPLANDADAARIVVRATDLLQNVTAAPWRQIDAAHGRARAELRRV